MKPFRLAILLFILFIATLSYWLSLETGRVTKSLPPPLSEAETDKEPNPVGKELDDLINDMDRGAVVLNAPEEMNIEETRDVRLTLSLSECLLPLMEKLSILGEQTIGDAARVSNRMMAELSGDMFCITAVGNKVQAVSRQDQTNWVWNINSESGMTLGWQR